VPEEAEATWESRKPPVRAFLIGLAVWSAWGAYCVGFAPDDAYPLWCGAALFAGWIWGALTLYVGAQAVQVAFWARSRAGRVAACVGFLISLVLQIAVWFRVV
jgi:hypothetical protein